MNISSVANFYQTLSKDTVHRLDEIYHTDIIFEDAAHKISGIDNLNRYFDALYKNVIRCDFDIQDQQEVGNSGFITWIMYLEHPKLSAGATIEVHGTSHIRFFENKVIYHRDYFDLGAMLYEHLPLLGSIVKRIKARLGDE
ncbi:transcriptional regulator [Vibrio sp. 10N.286.49.B3]|uniref:nuclear transport factor 2 family protein n=1 Tax=Vibrio sp. 10N.286.49.B3 TaxID=1880855 RepID=UPI000C86687B|nr:nuclear transport factor 2 family protein [Vibrio sp. 10N.286.49.B3]PMH46765.1 transcriptional regulator [Vibrio sp. 10N.286.49.B3]